KANRCSQAHLIDTGGKLLHEHRTSRRSITFPKLRRVRRSFSREIDFITHQSQVAAQSGRAGRPETGNNGSTCRRPITTPQSIVVVCEDQRIAHDNRPDPAHVFLNNFRTGRGTVALPNSAPSSWPAEK